MLAELGGVLGGGQDDEGEERGVGGAVLGDGEVGGAGVVLGGGENVVGGADGEVAGGGGGEVGEALGGGGAGGDEGELFLEVVEGDGVGLGEGVHVHCCFGWEGYG